MIHQIINKKKLLFFKQSIDNNLGNDGIAALCEGLKTNNSVTTLYLRSEKIKSQNR